MDANKLFTKFAVEKIWNKLKQHDKAMNSVLLILLPSNWILQDGKYKNTVQYSGFKSSDKLTVDLYDDGNLADLQLTEYEHYIDGFEIIDGALVAIASVRPTQTMTVVVKGGFQANESEVGDLSVFEDEINFLGNRPVNNNLLINSNFANPVNQRGVIFPHTVLADTYILDRWLSLNAITNLTESGLTLKKPTNSDGNASIVQKMEGEFAGKTITLSAKVDNIVHSLTVIVPDTDFTWAGSTIVEENLRLHVRRFTSEYTEVFIENISETPITVEWVKCEYGDHVTPYVPRLYAEEWLLCQRYYNILNSTPAKLTSITNDILEFSFTFGAMRTIPTVVDINILCVVINDSVFNDYNIFAVNRNSLCVSIYCEKPNHDVKSNDLVHLANNLVLDAEL